MSLEAGCGTLNLEWHWGRPLTLANQDAPHCLPSTPALSIQSQPAAAFPLYSVLDLLWHLGTLMTSPCAYSQQCLSSLREGLEPFQVQNWVPSLTLWVRSCSQTSSVSASRKALLDAGMHRFSRDETSVRTLRDLPPMSCVLQASSKDVM